MIRYLLLAAIGAAVIFAAAQAIAPSGSDWSLRGLVSGVPASDGVPADQLPPQRRIAQSESSEAAGQPVPVIPVPSEAPSAKVVPQDRQEITLSFAPLVKRTAPAVVNVYAARQIQPQRSPFAGDPFFSQFFGQRFDSRPRIEASLGSGVIVDAKGLVVTNNHVIEGADEVKIALSDGREFESDILMKDAKVDLAILKIRGDQEFPVLPLADSDALEIGDLVLAIGNPFGIGQTVTNGIVSAVARTHIGISDFGFFIQTDAAINPGNSGGALIGMDGRLVGVNTAIFSRSGGSNGIGFAIPSNMVRAFIQAAESGRRFQRPFVGASFTEVTPDIAEALGLPRPSGALIQSVLDGGPMAEAGIEVGDVVLSMDGFEIDNPDALDYRLATAGIGGSASFEILAGGDRKTIELTLGLAPEVPPRDVRTLSARTPFGGATVANLSPRVAEELQMPQGRKGVVVTAVEPGSLAARFGLAEKDIVLALNGQDVESTEALEAMLDEGGRGWRFTIERNGRRMTQVVR